MSPNADTISFRCIFDRCALLILVIYHRQPLSNSVLRDSVFLFLRRDFIFAAGFNRSLSSTLHPLQVLILSFCEAMLCSGPMTSMMMI